MKESAMQKPTVGRIVHVNLSDDDKGQPHAAIITHVWSDTCVNLHLFADACFFNAPRLSARVNYGEEAGHWHWPLPMLSKKD
jgi:hypothetical protein